MSAAGNRNLAVRLGTAAVGVPLLVYLLFGAPPEALLGLLAIVAGIASYELFRMIMPTQRLLAAWGVLSSVLLWSSLALTNSAVLIVGAVIALPMFGALLSLRRPEPVQGAAARVGWLFAAPIYTAGPLAALARLFLHENGAQWVVLALTFAWFSDTGAYFAGRAFGRHTLSPISPNKTVEGAIGGLCGSVAGVVLAHYWYLPSIDLPSGLALALIAGAAGQAGDLLESLIKRSTDVKDSGTIIPGHGGMLDRIDALVFTAVITWLYVEWSPF